MNEAGQVPGENARIGSLRRHDRLAVGQAALAQCQPGSTEVQMVSVGWPDVISSLKTLL
jgi:hypothetical protein